MITILRRIVDLCNERLGAFGPFSRQRTTAGMQEVEQRREQLPGRLLLGRTGS